MRPQETFLGQPIRDLQTMLRVIAKCSGTEELLIPDGIYSRQTAHTVACFQREHGLPATGVTDQETWDAVCRAYHPARINLTPACPLHILLDPNQIIGKGEHHAHLYLIQAMLSVFSECYGLPCPDLSGSLDGKTAQALEAFQGLCQLPVTGTLDKTTWKHMALQYPLAAVLAGRKTDSARNAMS